MKKSKLFDIIVYKFLLSLPVSCAANFVYGFMLFVALWVWNEPKDQSFSYFENNIFVLLISSAAIIPFILLNMARYIAIKSKHLSYGIIGLVLSTIPEYLFFVSPIIFDYINYIL